MGTSYECFVLDTTSRCFILGTSHEFFCVRDFLNVFLEGTSYGYLFVLGTHHGRFLLGTSCKCAVG